MKGLLRSLLLTAIFFTTAVYGYYQNIELYNEDTTCCYDYNPFAGIYVGANIGYSWYNFRLHRPVSIDLDPLNAPRWRLKDWIPLVAVGYDLFPKHKIPFRFEVNVTYEDKNFTQDPLFLTPADESIFSDDGFRFYNTMFTFYVDWHTCTPLVPYIGASAGYVFLDTEHDPRNRTLPRTHPNFSHSSRSFSYGGTIGGRFFITNHFIGNLQFRFNDLKELIFENKADVTLPAGRDYSSDYLHEHSLLVGIAYEF